MAINTRFQNYQKMLGDLSQQGQDARKVMGEQAQTAQTVSKVVMGVSAVIVIAAAVNIVAFPILGIIGVVLGAILLVSSYEASQVSKNVKDIVDDTLSLNNAAYRIRNMASVDGFTDSLFKDTLILGLGPVRRGCVNWLNQNA